MVAAAVRMAIFAGTALLSLAPPPPAEGAGAVDLGGGLTVELAAEARAQIDALLAAPADPSAEADPDGAFVDAFAGLLVAYAAGDPVLAQAMAGYAAQQAPQRSRAVDAALRLADPNVGAGSGPAAAAAWLTAPGSASIGPGTPPGPAAALALPQVPGALSGLQRDGRARLELGSTGAIARFSQPASQAGGRVGGGAGHLWGGGSFGPSGVPVLGTALPANDDYASPSLP